MDALAECQRDEPLLHLLLSLARHFAPFLSLSLRLEVFLLERGSRFFFLLFAASISRRDF